jgi:flagellin
MVINTNLAAQQSSMQLAESSSRLAKSLTRLSSGSRLASPEDDAAGLAVSTRFGAQISRTRAASNNVGNAISYAQTQDGFLQKAGKALDRMGELAILAQDVTKQDADRELYNAEFRTLVGYVKDIATKEFNGVSLFDGATRNVTTDGEGTAQSVFGMSGTNLGVGTAYAEAVADTTNVATTGAALTALGHVKTAITQLSTDRGTLGASLARLQYTQEQLSVVKMNLSAADSRLKDVNVAEETTEYARYQVLVQSGTAMLAQANAQPQVVLRLLGG